jgi:hypothetical protein
MATIQPESEAVQAPAEELIEDIATTESENPNNGQESVSKILAAIDDVSGTNEKLGDKLGRANAQSREVAVSTIIRLLGIPTVDDIALVEKKVDALTAKISSVQQRVERLASAIQSGSDFERFDVQLGDIHNLLKELLPRVITPKSSKNEEK